jgi:hypothetical protein
MGVWDVLTWWLIVFFIIALGAQVAFQLRRRAALPFHPGRYLFPTHILDARSRQLRIIPLHDLIGVKTFSAYVNGFHDTTVCIFAFREGAAQQITVSNKAEVEAGLRKLANVRASYEQALKQQDLQALQHFELFFEVRDSLDAFQRKASNDLAGGPLARNVLDLTWKRWLLAFAASVVLAAPSGLLVRVLGDNAAFGRAQKKGTPDAFLAYTENGWRHIEEAKELGVQANLKDCEKNDTEVCWRIFMMRWSDSPRFQEVRDERLPRAAFKDRSGTVSELRDFLRDYPNSVVDAEARSRLASMLGSQSSNSSP